MTKVSVISIAVEEKEFEPLKKALKKQTFKDFEFVTSTKGNIPESWNDAISRCGGEIIVFTETDASPLNERWLEELVGGLEKHNSGNPERKTLVRGLEIRPQVWNLCTLSCYKKVFDKHKFNEKFLRSEDSELFARLKKNDYNAVQLPNAAVIHNTRTQFKRHIKNGFSTGFFLAKTSLVHGQTGFTSSFSGGNMSQAGGLLKREFKIILNKIAFLSGIFAGVLSYYGGKLFKD